MIRSKLLVTAAIIASVVITACSDITAPKKLAPAGKSAAPILLVGSATARSAEVSGACAAPGTGLPGALNMLHDPTMFTTPMARDAAQGNAGMFHAVAVSGC
jgi:hypothetical protein